MGIYRPIGKRNEYVIKEDYAELYILDEYSNIKQVAIIDIEDIERLKKKPYHVRVANKHIGYYATIEEAVQARIKAEKEIYKEFATV